MSLLYVEYIGYRTGILWLSYEGCVVILQGCHAMLCGYRTGINSSYHTRDMVVVMQEISC